MSLRLQLGFYGVKRHNVNSANVLLLLLQQLLQRLRQAALAACGGTDHAEDEGAGL